VPIHHEITASALIMLCNVVSHDTFHSVITREKHLVSDIADRVLYWMRCTAADSGSEDLL